MSREQALKVVMVVVGLIFVAAAFPLVTSLRDWPHTVDVVPMFLSLYVTLGVFLLGAARNPSAHRTLIAFAAWSGFVHAAVMLVQSTFEVGGRPELFGMSAVLVLIGVLLVALRPIKPPVAVLAAPGS